MPRRAEGGAERLVRLDGRPSRVGQAGSTQKNEARIGSLVPTDTFPFLRVDVRRRFRDVPEVRRPAGRTERWPGFDGPERRAAWAWFAEVLSEPRAE